MPQSITFSAYKDSSPNNNSSSNTSNSNNQVVSVFGQNEINHGGQYSVLDNSNLTENLYNLANLANAASALPSLGQSSCIDQGLKGQNKVNIMFIRVMDFQIRQSLKAIKVYIFKNRVVCSNFVTIVTNF